MSLGTVPAVFAGQGLGSVGPSCTEVVEGIVTALDDSIHAIVVENNTTIGGVPFTWIDIEVGDRVVVNCFVSPEGKYVACYLTINGGDVIELRPRM